MLIKLTTKQENAIRAWLKLIWKDGDYIPSFSSYEELDVYIKALKKKILIKKKYLKKDKSFTLQSFDKVYNYTLFLIQRWQYNFFTLKNKLIHKFWKINDIIISEVLIKIKDNNLISDDNYAYSKMQTKLRSGKWSNHVKQYLYSKGIVNYEIDKDLELDELQIQYNKLLKKNLEKNIIIKKLLQKWYNYWDIKSLFN